MNIFLDSTVLWSDPFFQYGANKQLEEIAKSGEGVKIFISSVVLEEVRNNYRKNLHKGIADFKKAEKQLRSLVELETITLMSEEDYMQRFDLRYKELLGGAIFTQLNYTNELLPELVRRSIYRIKPFTETKMEFRDAIIWLSYTNYIAEHNLENCYFLTSNTKEYCKKGSQEIVDELKMESSGLVLFQNAKELLGSEVEPIQTYTKTAQLKQWLVDNPIEKHQVYKYLDHTSTYDYIYSRISDYYNNYFENVEINDVTGFIVDRFVVKIIGSELYIEGEINVEVKISVVSIDFDLGEMIASQYEDTEIVPLLFEIETTKELLEGLDDPILELKIEKLTPWE